jgi:hypothetical protein
MLIQAPPQTQVTPALPSPAPTPIPPVPQPSIFEVNPQTVTRPLTPTEASVIRRQRSEMSDQLVSAQNRRERVLGELRGAPPGTEEGLREQYQVLSDRIVSIERDIEASGRALRTGQIPTQVVLVPPRQYTRNRADDAERGAAMGAMILIPLAVVMLIRRLRRGRRGRTSTNTIVYDERMERLEQAVDAIALEIERVGEAQRYQTRVLAEANLMPATSGGRVGEAVRTREYEK